MKRLLTIFAITFIAITFADLSLAKDTVKQNTFYQISNIAALKKGAYTGLTTIGKLKEHGDFGIGTVEGLDGELVALGGKFYQVKSSGQVKDLENSAPIPFANVAFFKPWQSVALDSGDAKNFNDLKDSLDKKISPGDGIYAIKINGFFSRLKLRSPPKQTKPYPQLSEALKKQKVFEFKNTPGVMVGFCFPDYLENVNVPGYHFHFIGDKREIGGHVLDCSVSKAEVSWIKAERLLLELPVAKPLQK